MNRYIVCSSFIVIFFICMAQCEFKASHTSKNHQLLSKLGLTRVRGPNSHHRKRLAVESRHHARSDDSHIFIVKLPPNPYYYAHNIPNTVTESGRKIPVGFKNNGKPAKIYHWNIPVLKKMTAIKNKLHGNEPDHFDAQSTKIWNEVLDKPGHAVKDHHKSSYYVPKKAKKSSFHKYFSGNGKPKSFYVIEKSRKAHYHRLLP